MLPIGQALGLVLRNLFHRNIFILYVRRTRPNKGKWHIHDHRAGQVELWYWNASLLSSPSSESVLVVQKRLVLSCSKRCTCAGKETRPPMEEDRCEDEKGGAYWGSVNGPTGQSLCVMGNNGSMTGQFFPFWLLATSPVPVRGGASYQACHSGFDLEVSRSSRGPRELQRV